MADKNGMDFDQDFLEEAANKASGKNPAEKKGFVGFLKKTKLLIFILIGLIFCSLIAVGVWFFFLRGDNESSKNADMAVATEAAGEQGDAKPAVPPAFPEIVEFEPFEGLKLKPGSSMKSISLTFSLELVYPALRDDVVRLTPKIREIVEKEISEMTWLDLRTPEGKLNFRFTLIQEFNRALPRIGIKDFYYKQMVMQ